MPLSPFAVVLLLAPILCISQLAFPVLPSECGTDVHTDATLFLE